MTFLGLIGLNVWSRKLRSALTAIAVAIGVMAVVALGVLTASLKETATSILKVGNADFSVAQKNGDILSGTISDATLAQMRQVDGVGQIVGALIQTDRYDAANPGVIEVGLTPQAQGPFGVVLLQGRSYTANSPDEIMLGAVLAQNIHKGVGDTLVMGGKTRHVVGIYRTNVSFGNSTMMFPLSTLQAENQLTGQVTLGFVKVVPGASPAAVAARFNKTFLQYTAIRSASDYGRADRTLVLIEVANTGGTILAAVIAISGVLNTTLLSFFERTREFGVLRAVGWTRRRITVMVLGEATLVGSAGLVLGLAMGYVAIRVLQHVTAIQGYLNPTYDAAIFIRAFVFAFAVVLVGAAYPAVRAGSLSPVEALSRE
jgi:putative ABC transport system permease protein